MNHQEKMYGVADGITYQQNERTDDLNKRIIERQFPDYPLEPNYEPRPVPTKYSIFPIVDRRTPAKETRLDYPVHDSYINFNPGSNSAPIKGYFKNVDTETVLRNQTFSLQNTAHNTYIPSSKSDLYNVTVISSPSEQPYPLLFDKPALDKKLHPNVKNSDIGKNIFFNATRVQLRNGL
uniref:Uncharacterized protein n=1 Tax=viral metagenome TaxID=1070528 RepID=A0A6C0B7P0_9ZZZZ